MGDGRTDGDFGEFLFEIELLPRIKRRKYKMVRTKNYLEHNRTLRRVNVMSSVVALFVRLNLPFTMSC